MATLATAELRAYTADAPNKWRQIIFQGYCTRRLRMPTRDQRQIFYQVKNVKTQRVGSGIGEQILIRKDGVSIKETPEKEQKKGVRKHSI